MAYAVAEEEDPDDRVYHGDEVHVDREDDTELSSCLCSEGFDENDRESLAFLADVVQSETIAFTARSKAKGKSQAREL